MPLLAIDTSTLSCSVAIVEATGLRMEITLQKRDTHAKHLMALIKQSLETSGMMLKDIDAFAVTRGPGTFTGLRIGISTAKGLAMALGKPLVGVSSLESLTIQTGSSLLPIVCPMIDARRGEVYFAIHRITPEGDIITVTPEGVGTPRDALKKISEVCIFVGNGARLHEKTIRNQMGAMAHFASPHADNVRASTIACIGKSRLNASACQDPALLMPVYIRKSDAEIHLKS